MGEGVDACLQWLDDTTSQSISDAEFFRQEEALLALAKRVVPPGYKVVPDRSASTIPGPR